MKLLLDPCVLRWWWGEPDKLSAELASALRRDPDVIMVDRCEDSSVMDQLQEAATQKIVLLGLRASDSFSALAKWVRGVGHTTPAMSVLLGVINQRILRKLCPTCREAYKPDPQMLAKINISAGQIEQFYRPPSGPLTDEKGRPYTCPTCQGSGY
jgi:type IV pilus assembly protein PilB